MNIEIQEFYGQGLSLSELAQMVALFRQLDNQDIVARKDDGLEMISVTDEYLADELVKGDGFIAIDKDFGMIVGMIFNNRSDSYRNGMAVTKFVVDAKYRQRGVGKMLLSAVLKENDTNGDATTLMVSGSNDAALRLYRQFGFDITDFQMTRKPKKAIP